MTQFPLTFLQSQRRMSPFHHSAYDHSRSEWDGLRDGFLRNVPRKDIFKLDASSADTKSSEWVQVGTVVASHVLFVRGVTLHF